jgi:tripartite-type tricarboxylate transporter receptor subunit TctC
MHQRVQGGRLAWPVVWLCAATLCATSAAAQSWKPEKNVEIIVPGGAGGGQDRTARIMSWG